MRAVIISDTHELERKMAPLPKGDLLIHCGDFSGRGSMNAISRFAKWMGEQDFKWKVVISGNHELGMQYLKHDNAVKILTDNGLIYLQDSSVEIEGLHLYGSPWQPEFYNWEWNLPRGKALAEKWALIPNDVDVLITHGAPAGILDIVPSFGGAYDSVGDEDLLMRVKELTNLKLMCFGHLHSGYGTLEQDDVLYCNASICDEAYNPIHLPIEVELTKEKAFAYKRATDYTDYEEETK